MQHFNIATFWSVVNSLILGAFIITAFSENHAARVEAKRAARAPPEPMPEDLENHLAAAVEHRRDTPFGREQIVGARHAIDDLASGNAPVAGSRYSTLIETRTTHDLAQPTEAPDGHRAGHRRRGDADDPVQPTSARIRSTA